METVTNASKENGKIKNTIVIGSDHAGFSLKEKIISELKKKGYIVEDKGAFSEDSVDYPDIAKSVAKIVSDKKNSGNCSGILICGTGIGMSITANKIKGIRAALCHSKETAHLAREHNNANILCMGARVINEKTALTITKEFLDTRFSSEERHIKRVQKLE